VALKVALKVDLKVAVMVVFNRVRLPVVCSKHIIIDFRRLLLVPFTDALFEPTGN
jgi:hypothetical protein